MKRVIRQISWAARLLAVSSVAFAAAVPAPPTKVTVNKVEGVDRATGAFILEWSPAINAATGKPYPKYLLSAGCKYEGMDPGTTAGHTGVSGLWQATVTGTSFRVKVTCSCVVTPYRSNSIRTAGPDAYTPGSTWVNTQKFLIPCGGR